MNKTTIYSTIIASTIAILSILAFTSSQADAAPPPDVSIDDVSLAEGNSGLTTFTFTVTRSDNTDAVSVDLATADGTATTADNDYPASAGTLNFQAGGLLSKSIPVQVNGDTKVEPDETFFVDLSNCVGCIITDNQGQGTIQNDDAAPPSKVSDIVRLVPMAGENAGLLPELGNAYLFYGDDLCRTDFLGSTSSPGVLYFEFATTTTVHHLATGCAVVGGSFVPIILQGATNTVFQAGDVLVLRLISGGWTEEFREQTP